jgi:hypothetical protein
MVEYLLGAAKKVRKFGPLVYLMAAATGYSPEAVGFAIETSRQKSELNKEMLDKAGKSYYEEKGEDKPPQP